MRNALLLAFLLSVGLATATAAHPPVAGPLEVFASGLAGPEGLAFTKDGGLIAGSTTGDLLRFEADGSATLLAALGDPLTGISVLRDGRILAASLAADRIWSVAPSGAVSVFASGIGGPNFIAQTRNGRILASASLSGTLLDITDGTAVVLASGLLLPNGLAIGGYGEDRALFVAETLRNRILRYPLDGNDALGTPEVYAEGLPLPDGMAFDRAGNLLVVGGGSLHVVLAGTRDVQVLSTDALLDGPSNLAFASQPTQGKKKRKKFKTKKSKAKHAKRKSVGNKKKRKKASGRRAAGNQVYLANFGLGLGDGTSLVRFDYNHPGADLIR